MTLRSTHVAILERRGEPLARRALVLPPEHGVDMGEGSALQAWLHPYIGDDEWRVVRFVELLQPVVEIV